jgi:hypothetical protein
MALTHQLVKKLNLLATKMQYDRLLGIFILSKRNVVPTIF